MTEVEIAKLVAEAVAAHDDTTTWGEELLANAETIATLMVAGIVGIGVVIRSFHSLDKRLQSVEDYRSAHDAADREAHGALERESGHILREVRDFREESTRQHDALGSRVEAAIDTAKQDRKDMHTKIDGLSKDVQRIVGYHEARKDAEK